jgi:acetyltransferase-like isoleucine patch superfamily enzyme
MFRELIRRYLGLNQAPRMLYNQKVKGKAYSYSNTVVFQNPENIFIGEMVHIWHYSIIDGTARVSIGDGCEIGSWAGIFTHSSFMSIRINGYHRDEKGLNNRKGIQIEPVEIGAFCGIGPYSIVLPGSTIGKGCLLKPYTTIPAGMRVPDFAVVEGNGLITGDTRIADSYFLKNDPEAKKWYDEWMERNI